MASVLGNSGCATTIRRGSGSIYSQRRRPAQLSEEQHFATCSEHLTRCTCWFCRLLPSLNIFTTIPVDPAQIYMVGVAVIGVPGFDFLSPIGTSGMTIGAAINPCSGDYGFSFAGLQIGLKVPTPVDLEIGVKVALNQFAYSKLGNIDPTVYSALLVPSTFWTVRCAS